uniref:Coiled-coil domain-containing protein n=1 Tax=Cajanus cajan TaxID=3821 RepID=A0A151SDX3_CAJCA|nr:Coiled-coil domain-containing protein [Cajanus cajan]
MYFSSLAAASADNFYYPPEWDPSQGSLNKFNGQHALRERARKIDQGILIIRFEMPFNVWCGGCNSMIAKGVRFNAEKIWSFTMKAACCKLEIIIQTDPKNSQKKRVAEEETASRKRGLGKRALTNAGSIFPGLSVSSMSDKRRLDLESKRRKISASEASKLLVGEFKPSQWSQGAVSSSRQKGASVNLVRSHKIVS